DRARAEAPRQSVRRTGVGDGRHHSPAISPARPPRRSGVGRRRCAGTTEAPPPAVLRVSSCRREPAGKRRALPRPRSGDHGRFHATTVHPEGDVTLALVFAAALATAIATGLGAVPFAVARSRAQGWLGQANAVASGVMLGASASLLIEAGRRSPERGAVGMVAGCLFVALAQRLVGERNPQAIGGLRGLDARKAILIVAVMTVHSVAEGVGVGAAFGGGDGFGLLISAAIALHNVPEGLAISLVLVPRGTRVRTAALWSVFSSLPQPLLAVPSFAFVDAFAALLPAGLGFAAGAMIWMVVRELLPEALEQVPLRTVIADGGIAF